jgi:hypothetical protein
MHSRRLLNQTALAALLGLVPGLSAAQSPSDARWQVTQSGNGTRYLTYSATASVLGKPVAHQVTFFCNPHSTRTEKGMLGLEVRFNQVSVLKAFPFDAFEGPDATTHGKKLLRLTVIRPGQPDAHMNTDVNGWTPDTQQFTFGTAADSQAARSTERTVLQALAHDADSLRITITHPRDPNTTLAVQVPVAARRGDFKALLEGLK